MIEGAEPFPFTPTGHLQPNAGGEELIEVAQQRAREKNGARRARNRLGPSRQCQPKAEKKRAARYPRTVPPAYEGGLGETRSVRF